MIQVILPQLVKQALPPPRRSYFPGKSIKMDGAPPILERWESVGARLPAGPPVVVALPVDGVDQVARAACPAYLPQGGPKT